MEQVLVRSPTGRKGIPGRRHSKCKVKETGKLMLCSQNPVAWGV